MDKEWLRSHAELVRTTYAQRFEAEKRRFKDWARLMDRYKDVVDQVLEAPPPCQAVDETHNTPLRAVDETHNELCVAYDLLQHSTPWFSSLAYEPQLPHCRKTIDFRAVTDQGETVFVDVKTITPQDENHWRQYIEAQTKERLPAEVKVILEKAWRGGELWHDRTTSRDRMLGYTVELEQKIRECQLSSDKTGFILMLCGEGAYWREDWLEDFVEFYTTGQHRQDDPLRQMEAYFIAEKHITLSRSIWKFACMNRPQGAVDLKRINWNVHPPMVADVPDGTPATSQRSGNLHEA